ncbi:MAG TPA: NINE protein [Arsenophonus apicola]|uniref:TM2 domain-containing protein n=1 Tax=Arsenophonus apicola TaxID=2879119 RepID=UPI001CDD5F77|nr:TM2 domain-containing protein [Arsenophonus apicola]UBX30972.1 TM2 domain-containing protein [Arsenophonus apicola]
MNTNTKTKESESNMIYCSGCGKAIHETAPTCPNCGAINKNVEVTGTKSRVAAAVLAFFLGGFGIHKFYLGKILQGFLYLIFCWTFIPTVIAFIEFIVYLCMSDQDFAKKYG